MRLKGLVLAALVLAGLLAAPARADSLDPALIPGIVLSAGRTDTRNGDSGVGSGFFLDGNYTRTAVNAGTDYQQYGTVRVLNVYAGAGFGRLIQLQAGYGNDGVVKRVRTDLNLSSMYDFVAGRHRDRYNQALGNRLTFVFAAESYSSHPRLNNFHIGVGLLY